ncbi:MAG: hypothetical protein KBD60_04380 [Sterolibacterium sp.]|jgi:hypothetical protein|nr:hypothetical protein [Sterolibacterium sp.]
MVIIMDMDTGRYECEHALGDFQNETLGKSSGLRGLPGLPDQPVLNPNRVCQLGLQTLESELRPTRDFCF